MLLVKLVQGTPSLGGGWGEAPCHESSLCKTFYNLFSNLSNFFPFFLANTKKKKYVCAIFKDDRLADTAKIK